MTRSSEAPITGSDPLYCGELVEWYDRLYYLNEQTSSEAGFYVSVLSRNGCVKINEVSAGTGRLTIPLALKGFDLTATDRSHEMLEFARTKAYSLGLQIAFLKEDMRAPLHSEKQFDCVMVPCSALGYLTKTEELISFLRSCHNRLMPAGLLIIDVPNYWAKLVNRQSSSTCTGREDDGYRMTITSEATFHQRRNLARFDQKIERWRGDQQLPDVHRSFTLRLFTLTELEMLLEMTHFTVVEDASAYEKGAVEDRLLIVARKT